MPAWHIRINESHIAGEIHEANDVASAIVLALKRAIDRGMSSRQSYLTIIVHRRDDLALPPTQHRHGKRSIPLRADGACLISDAPVPG